MRRRTLLASTAALPAVAGCSNVLPTGTNDQPQTPHEESPRVDTPPHEINRPDPPDGPPGEGDWNDDYLGETMPTEPSLSFERVSARLTERYQLSHDLAPAAYRVGLVDDASALSDHFALDRMDDADRDALAAVDFDTHVLAVVVSGFGSGSVSHRWARAEADDDGIHLHGYYSAPFVQTDDYTIRTSALQIERPADGVGLLRVSLTTDETTRVHFNSTEGAVSVDD